MKKVAFLPQKKTGFETKTKKDTIHKEGHCIMIKGISSSGKYTNDRHKLT